MAQYVMRFALMTAALLALISLSSLRGASADSGARSYQYVLGAGQLCELEESACPDVAMADNGDTIDIAGEGALSIHSNSISGGGTFTHHFSGGSVSGTWAANKLLGFHEWGCGGGPFPSNFCGGRVLMNVTLSVGGAPVHNAILQFDCLIGTPPAGAEEGVRLAVQDALNFSEKVSGDTLLIKQ